MKEYIVTWTCNNFAWHDKLENCYRHINESLFKCDNLAELFNSINNFLKIYKEGFYPEVVDIREN